MCIPNNTILLDRQYRAFHRIATLIGESDDTWPRGTPNWDFCSSLVTEINTKNAIKIVNHRENGFSKELQQKILHIISQKDNELLSASGLEGRLLALIPRENDPIAKVFSTAKLIFYIYTFLDRPASSASDHQSSKQNFPLTQPLFYTTCRKGMERTLKIQKQWEKNEDLLFKDLVHYTSQCNAEGIFRQHPNLKSLRDKIEGRVIQSDGALERVFNKIAPLLKIYCPHFEEVELHLSSLTKKGFQTLFTLCPQIVKLDLIASTFSQTHSYFLENMLLSGLEELSFSGYKDWSFVTALENFMQFNSRISSLTFDMPLLLEKDLKKLIPSFRKLTTLHLKKIYLLDEESFHALAHYCEKLQKLSLPNPLIYLSKVCIDNDDYFLSGSFLTDKLLEALTLKRLSYLDFAFQRSFTEEGLKKLLARHPTLADLDLTGCNQIRDKCIEELAEIYPTLTIVSKKK